MDPLQVVPEKDIKKLIQMLQDVHPQSLHVSFYLNLIKSYRELKPFHY